MTISKTSARLYLKVPYEDREWAKNEGLEYDSGRKAWWLPKGRDPLCFRKYWAFLDPAKTYEDRELLKQRGCIFEGKAWYVPENLNFDDFVEWWPSDLRKYLIDDRFSIHGRAPGDAGQADVYRAFDVSLGTGWHAIKVFKDPGQNISKELQKNAANAEIKALEKLEHPNILKLTTVGLLETRQIYIVMPWAAAGNLAAMIGGSDTEKAQRLYASLRQSDFDLDQEEDDFVTNQIRESKGTWPELARILIGILEGLEYAHGAGVYHRDIKPQNILFDAEIDGETGKITINPLICDFGAAKIRDEITDPNRTIVQIRTPAYRWKHDHETNSSQNTWDLVSWGVIAVELLSNQRVDSPAHALEILTKTLSLQIDEDLTDLLSRAIAENADDRPTDITEFKNKFALLAER